ncbi:hypothetical protein CGCSCA4_v004644 [Colletotrichum siamense]|uniref:Uncharacterized protein n=1 Tax=Colletotrichum siamense TaxID=690259 RepID=A0A9P5EX06_COLSI|nr:hypothetical protein CGCSCA4_v004644 [Colletotrichum siamense]KAF4861438.1 hypothetical protein CGCSCA2_v004410 [Colletotrichum siamense]
MTDPCVRNDVYLQKRYIHHVYVCGSTASKLANKVLCIEVNGRQVDLQAKYYGRLGMSMQMAIQ